MKTFVHYFITFLIISCSTITVAVDIKVDENLKNYQKRSGVFGNLSSIGSDTLSNLMALWAEEFKRFYPSVNIQLQSSGSSTAPPALVEGTANLGPMSRRMKDREIASFENRHGYKPTAIAVAIDALAVYTHKDNPLDTLSLEQLDAIFSSTYRCSEGKNITRWGELDLRGLWAGRQIQLFGRNSVSGTYSYFKKSALCKGDFKKNVNEQPGSASVVSSVSQSINSIGYSGFGYRTAAVKLLALTNRHGFPVYPSPQSAIDGSYPLSRFLWIYINKKPNQKLAPLENEFLKMVLSSTGQKIVVKDGYIPMPKSVVDKQLELLGETL